MKHLKLILALLCASVCWQTSLATDVVIDGLKYSLDESAETATVIANSSSPYMGDVNIPSFVNYNGITYDVTDVGDNAFYKSKITSIVISEGVKTIGVSSFDYCTSLKSVSLPNGLKTLGNSCFGNCYVLESISFPEGITDLPFNCCVSNKKLTEVSLPESLVTLGEGCFGYCVSLKRITIPKNVTSFGRNCFLTVSLTTMICKATTPPDALQWNAFPSVTNLCVPSSAIGLYASTRPWSSIKNIYALDELCYEYNKETLRATLLPNDYSDNISIPETTIKDMAEYTVDSIAPNCFEGAELDTLVIPATVQKFGADAFKKAKIKNWTYNGTIGNWCACRFANAEANPIHATETRALVLDSVEVKSAVIPTSIKKLQPYAFYNCASLDSVEVNMFITEIGDSCFAGSNIKYLETKTHEPPTLGKYALPASIGTAVVPQDYYGEYYKADGWKDLNNIISSTDKKTESYFVADKALYLLNKEAGEISVCNPVDAISQTAEYKGAIVLPSTVEYNHKSYPLTAIGSSCFKDNTAVDSIALPATLKTIETSAFSGCKGINDLKLLAFCDVPASTFNGSPLVSVESGNEKFWQSFSSYFASTLETAIVTDDYTGMCPSFTNYTKLKNVTLSDKTNVISSFEGCTSLTEITIPSEVLSIGEDAFKNCRNLKTLNLLALYGASFGGNAFVNCTGLETLNFGGDVSDWCSLVFENKYANPMYYAKTVLFQGEELDSLDVSDNSDAKYNNYAFVNLKSLRKLVIP